ncbi:MAG: hypothetical protein GX139_07935 [Armatimonadetes bacterium]|jgi:hypothetical protein|nr:hypothetical protein [Armatimonadota bacterium]
MIKIMRNTGYDVDEMIDYLPQKLRNMARSAGGYKRKTDCKYGYLQYHIQQVMDCTLQIMYSLPRSLGAGREIVYHRDDKLERIIGAQERLINRVNLWFMNELQETLNDAADLEAWMKSDTGPSTYRGWRKFD